MKERKIYILLALLLILVPLGLITSSPAWGEWTLEEIKNMIGYVPEGIKNSTSIIKPLIPDYQLEGVHPVVGYYISAVVGVIVIIIIFYGIKMIMKK